MATPTDPFQTTSKAWMMIVRAQGKDDDASTRLQCLDYLARRYWTPVYAFIRRTGCNEDQAEDLCQEYFRVFLEKRYLDQVSRERGRFRSFLFTSLHNFLRNKRRYDGAIRRDGKHVPLRCSKNSSVTGMLPVPAQSDTAEGAFMREWARSVMALAFKAMEARCLADGTLDYWEVFRRHDGSLGRSQKPSYAETASELGWDIERVRRKLHRARKKFAGIVREVVRESVRSDKEVDSELRDLRRYF